MHEVEVMNTDGKGGVDRSNESGYNEKGGVDRNRSKANFLLRQYKYCIVYGCMNV